MARIFNKCPNNCYMVLCYLPIFFSVLDLKSRQSHKAVYPLLLWTWLFAHACLHSYKHTYTHTHTHTHACTHTHAYTQIYIQTHAHTHTHIHICKHTHISMYVYNAYKHIKTSHARHDVTVINHSTDIVYDLQFTYAQRVHTTPLNTINVTPSCCFMLTYYVINTLMR